MCSPLLSSHFYLMATLSCLVIEMFTSFEPPLRGHLSYKAIFYLSQR